MTTQAPEANAQKHIVAELSTNQQIELTLDNLDSLIRQEIENPPKQSLEDLELQIICTRRDLYVYLARAVHKKATNTKPDQAISHFFGPRIDKHFSELSHKIEIRPTFVSLRFAKDQDELQCLKLCFAKLHISKASYYLARQDESLSRAHLLIAQRYIFDSFAHQAIEMEHAHKINGGKKKNARNNEIKDLLLKRIESNPPYNKKSAANIARIELSHIANDLKTIISNEREQQGGAKGVYADMSTDEMVDKLLPKAETITGWIRAHRKPKK